MQPHLMRALIVSERWATSILHCVALLLTFLSAVFDGSFTENANLSRIPIFKIWLRLCWVGGIPQRADCILFLSVADLTSPCPVNVFSLPVASTVSVSRDGFSWKNFKFVPGLWNLMAAFIMRLTGTRVSCFSKLCSWQGSGKDVSWASAQTFRLDLNCNKVTAVWWASLSVFWIIYFRLTVLEFDLMKFLLLFTVVPRISSAAVFVLRCTFWCSYFILSYRSADGRVSSVDAELNLENKVI